MEPGSREGDLLGDRYKIIRHLGSGGMGSVYEVEHIRTKGRYAAKMLLQNYAVKAEVQNRFRDEAQIVASLRHPHIVQVMDFDYAPDGTPYIVMEFLEGHDLEKRVNEGPPFSVAETLRIAKAVCGALATAHEKGIVHRDIKPGNIFLLHPKPGVPEGMVKVVDFGIAKIARAGSQATREGSVLGTPMYMAPEIALGEVSKIDPRSDQFSLAIVLYQMLSGRHPFAAPSPDAQHRQTEALGPAPALAATPEVSIMYRIVHEAPPPLVGVPAPIAAAIMRALSKDRDARFANIMDFWTALSGEAAASSAPSPTPTSPGAGGGDRRHALLIALLGCLTLSVVAMVLLGKDLLQPARSGAPLAPQTQPTAQARPDPAARPTQSSDLSASPTDIRDPGSTSMPDLGQLKDLAPVMAARPTAAGPLSAPLPTAKAPGLTGTTKRTRPPARSDNRPLFTPDDFVSSPGEGRKQ